MSTNTITSPACQVISRHKFAEVLQNSSSGQKSLHATVSLSPGDVICAFAAGTTQDYATYLTVQTAARAHITLMPKFLQYINNSCDPSVFFDTTAIELCC